MSEVRTDQNLRGYVNGHTERGDCKCGKCFDLAGVPDPAGHTADMVFFRVAKAGSPSREEFLSLTRGFEGEFLECDPLDGVEHGYMELGGWLGDQGLAMQYMALGVLLGVFDLLTPKTMLPDCDDGFAMDLAMRGFVTVKAKAAV